RHARDLHRGGRRGVDRPPHRSRLRGVARRRGARRSPRSPPGRRATAQILRIPVGKTHGDRVHLAGHRATDGRPLPANSGARQAAVRQPRMTAASLSSWVGSGAVRAVATLSAGQFVAAAIPFLAAPVLGRLYLPADYGVLATYMAIANILGAMSTLQFAT